MHQPGLATRRFYHAFYRWNRHCLHQRDHIAASSRRTIRREFHHARQLRDGESVSEVGVRRVVVPHSNTKVRNGNFPARKRSIEWRTSRRSIISGWVNSPIESPDIRPSDTLGPWEQVIRYRSAVGIMVTTALPAEAVSELSSVYGEGLAGLSARFGANVEVGSHVMQDDKRLTAISLSGTHQEAATTWKELERFKAKHTGAIIESKVDESVRGLPSGKEEQSETTRETRDESAVSSKSDVQPISLSDVQDEQLSTRLWEEIGVQSIADRPTESIAPWDIVLRDRWAAKCEAELIVPSADWDKITQLLSAHQLEQRFSITIKVGSLVEHPSTPPCVVRPLSVIGEAGKVQKLYTLLKTKVSSLPPEAFRRDPMVVADPAVTIGSPTSLATGAYELSIPMHPSTLAQHWKIDCLREKILTQSGCTKLDLPFPYELRDDRNGLKAPSRVIIQGDKANVEVAAKMVHDALYTWVPLRTRLLVLDFPQSINHLRPVLISELVGGDRRMISIILPRYLCNAWVQSGKIVVHGTEERVAQARKTIQAIVDDTLNKRGGSAKALIVKVDKRFDETESVATLRQIDADRNPSQTTSQSGQSDASYARTVLYLRIHPQSGALKNPVPQIIGKDGSRLASIGKESDCIINYLREQSLFRIHGFTQNVSKARTLIEKILLEVCRERVVQTDLALTEQPAPPAFNWHLRLRIPDHPKMFAFRPMVFGGKRSHLNSLEEMHLCMVDLKDGSVEITGTKKGVHSARRALQRTLHKACEADGIQEPLELKAIEPFVNLSAPQEEPKVDNLPEPQGEEIEILAPDPVGVAEEIKTALRPLTHPVVLVTSRMKSETKLRGPDTQLGACRGVTISSFNAVTLSPTPIISFNLKVPSRTWDAIQSSGSMCAHILPATPAGAAVANAFTQPYDSPSEPFRILQRHGIGFRIDRTNRSLAPKISKGLNTVGILAKLMKDQCVYVGDHVVVVAQVTHVRFLGDQDSATQEEMHGLAYSMRGFRSIGTEIEPSKLEELSEKLAGTAEKMDDMIDNEEDEIEDTVSSPGKSELTTVDDTLPQTSGDSDGDLFAAFSDMPMEDDEPEMHDILDEDRIKRRVIVDEEDDYDLDFENDGDESSSVSLTGQRSSFQNFRNDVPTQMTATANAPIQPGNGLTSRRTLPGAAGAWGVASPHLKSSYSTVAGSDHPHSQPRSVNRELEQEREDETRQELTDQNIKDPRDLVTDQTLLKSTIGDFLGRPDKFYPPSRIRALLSLQKEAYAASRRLKRALADGTLTEAESARLEKLITSNERRVAKTLALRSARDLQNMLDKGRVDVRRAQWLESAIEKGQAVVLDEARQLRQMLDEGVIDAARFAVVKEGLEGQHRVLSTETMRLRQMVDEEGDEGNGGGDVAEGASGFDGFKGNV